MPGSETPQQIEIEESVALAPLTTIGIGGPARFFTRATTETQLLAALRFARDQRLELLVLGGGSNLLVRDGGFAGLVVQLAIAGDIESAPSGTGVSLRVPAGMDWDLLVRHTCEKDLSGMECLAGVPGLTGGTPVQNVGAYGQDVSQTIRSVRAFDRQTDAFREIAAEDCVFRYRSSRFNTGERERFLITAVTFRLERGGRAPLQYADLRKRFGDSRPAPMQIYEAVREIRRAKGMLLVPGDPDCRSVGSFFKNPVVSRAVRSRIAQSCGIPEQDVPHWPSVDATEKLAAAWLLERAGFHRGHALGRVGISSRHTLALINRGGATFAELAALRSEIRESVQDRFGVVLEQEPVEVGEMASNG